ncbi:ComEC/Rec2 family competence protein [Alkaliphilus transvaalensis]|uniref:ComEC/Rec2 family competence protein n=1 Tax=Alkaliphilus transvaalensis TaxID=114628 RepID=UPI0005592662|nr:MBL fold metallo-hydrolase [Alkaliphilus transvaalensis]
MKIINNRIHLLIFILIMALFLTSCQSDTSSYLSIHVLDVGQGDSILIITPNNKTILIDAGEAEYGTKVVNYLKNNRIKKIDWLIATHPHSDHIGGLVEVINQFDIGEIYMPPVVHTSRTFENLIGAIDEKGMKITAGRDGKLLEIDEDLFFRFLGPLKDYGDHLNNWSIVNQLRYKEKTFIFMGDAELEVEKDLISTYSSGDLKSHFIKIGHHGSNSSSSKDFLESLRPDVAVISSGKNNSYGHPHKEVVDRINEGGIHLYRTDLQGTIVFYSDGEKIWSPKAPIND